MAKEEARKLGGDMSKVIIGGFSQGSMVTLASLLRYRGEKPFGGVIGLSGVSIWEKMGDIMSKKDSSRIADTPLFLYNGDKDHYFDPRLVDFSYNFIKKYYTKPDGKVHKNFHA